MAIEETHQKVREMNWVIKIETKINLLAFTDVGMIVENLEDVTALQEHYKGNSKMELMINDTKTK